MQQCKSNSKKMIFKKNLNILLYNMLSQEIFNYHEALYSGAADVHTFLFKRYET